jgi:hypothetical protein
MVIETAGGVGVEAGEPPPLQLRIPMPRGRRKMKVAILRARIIVVSNRKRWLISALYRRLIRSQHIAILYRWQAISASGSGIGSGL